MPITVPETASIEGIAAPAAVSDYPTLELLTKGLAVTVWTSPAKVTSARSSAPRARSRRPGSSSSRSGRP